MTGKKRLSSVEFFKATGNGGKSQMNLATVIGNLENTIRGKQALLDDMNYYSVMGPWRWK